MGDGQMAGRVCLVTGATSGIGLATARELAAMGAMLILAGRKEAKTRAVAEQIKQQTGNPSIDIAIADLAAQGQIRSLAHSVLARYEHLHVLINNAGAVYNKRATTVDGVEMTFAVDHLAYFLLTDLLLDRLKAGAPARIVNVASDAHKGARIDFDDAMGERGYRPFRAYGQAKLANILFTYELARRLEGSGVTANCVHPGLIASGFGHNNGGMLSLGLRIIAPFTKKPEQGAETVVYLAASPDVEGVSGRYYVKKRPIRSSPASYDEASARRLWAMSAELTGLSTPAPTA